MTRTQLEHIIRAAGAIAEDDDILIVGSQTILGQFPNASPELLISVEADVIPMNSPERSDLIDAALGDGSRFERTYGYFAHGVAFETSTLPPDWRDRLIRIENENTRGVRGWCLEVHDLAIAKLAAGRPKGLDFVNILVERGLASPSLLVSRAASTALEPEMKSLLLARVGRWR